MYTQWLVVLVKYSVLHTTYSQTPMAQMGGTIIVLLKVIYMYTNTIHTNNFIQFLQQTYLWITYHRIITKEEII